MGKGTGTGKMKGDMVDGETAKGKHMGAAPPTNMVDWLLDRGRGAGKMKGDMVDGETAKGNNIWGLRPLENMVD